MNKTTIESDFLAARAKTAVTIMNANGWQQGVVNPECISSDSVFFYVFDYQTRWIWCCSISRNLFYSALEQSKSADRSVSITCCGQMIAICAEGAKSARGARAAKGNSVSAGPDVENDLAIALTGYIGITRSYQLSERATKANHFIVVRYGLTDTLRPFAMGGPARYLIAANEIERAIAHVITLDMDNHPEWIAKN